LPEPQEPERGLGEHAQPVTNRERHVGRLT
jgi:hypothetical protein